MSCAIKKSHKDNPRSKEVYKKVSKAHKGKILSDETKQKMSNLKKIFYKTPAGIKVKKILSKKASIQQSKGSLKGFHRKGYFLSKKNQQNIYYGSSYELRALFLLENNESVVSFKTQIPIEINNRNRCIDILVNYKDKIQIIEVKPQKRLSESKVIEQINDIQQYALKNNFEFKVWSEIDSQLKNYKEILIWAESFIFRQDNIDFAKIRKTKNIIKVQKYYEKHLKNDKVTINCDFCKEQHNVMRLQYDNNIKKNGRFICIKENGSIIGKKPKLHLIKENPYKEQGKKECTKCKQILEFICFGNDKSRRDGYANKCKACRTKK